MRKNDIVQCEVQLDVADFSEDVIAGLSAIEAAICNLKDALCAQLSKDNLLSGISTGVEGTSLLFNIGEKIDWSKLFANIPAIKDYMEAVKFSIPEMGGFAAMFPKLSMALLDVGDKAKEIGSTIGTAFKSLGSVIGKFGVGKAALIGLAVAAVIGLVKLIIDNWDVIVATLSAAPEWFNTNVIQPVVGFFTGAMEWISTKIQEGFAFIQNIFAGVNEFLQGVFAKDWTEQFGAFGNVLNAFFANVENVWNAVKSIFSGIVSFVKNVFAGDWGAAWDSIVSVFKGIWDYLVAVVKAPINGIIGLINGLVQGVVDGINLVIGALNGLSFDVPDWVPLIGGQTFGFNITPLVAPQIPLLAKGAVCFLKFCGGQQDFRKLIA